MSIVIFAFGVLVFLITVYGTVVVGGLFLTSRQLEAQPELVAGSTRSQDATAGFDRARALFRSKF